jgi:hypothetical protein
MGFCLWIIQPRIFTSYNESTAHSSQSDFESDKYRHEGNGHWDGGWSTPDSGRFDFSGTAGGCLGSDSGAESGYDGRSTGVEREKCDF